MHASQTIGLVATVVSLYVALLSQRFSRAPGWREQRFFALIALSGAAYTLAGALPDSVVLYATQMQMVIAGWHLAAWIRFSAACLGHAPTGGEKWLMGAVIATSLGALIPGAYLTGVVTSHSIVLFEARYADAEPTTLGIAAMGIFCVTLGWLLARFVIAWRRGVPRTGIHALGLIGLSLAGLNDAVVTTVEAGMPYLLDLGFMLPIATVGYALTARFVEDARALERLSAELESAVGERTRELARSQEALHRAEKLGAIGQLAAGVAHEVNNPAAAIAANLRYLEEFVESHGALPDDGVRCLQESRGSIERITRVARQLLDAGRLAGSSATETHAVSLAEVAREAARLASPHYGKRVALIHSVPAELFGRGQEPALVQIVANLVVNAAQAMPAERTDGRVELTAARVGDRVELVVSDNGSGMSEATLGRLFEPFFSTKPFGEGTGLGLAVSRGLVMALGGQLRFTSRLGEGSRAVLDLLAAETPPRQERTPPVERTTPAGRARRVLIIDDDPELRSALRRCLKDRYEVTLADGTEAALTALERDREWDLIVCDLMMADGGGTRVYDTLHASAPDLAARLVFLTGGAVTNEARDFLARQPQPVLYKPLDLAALAHLAERVSAGSSASEP